MPHPHRVSRRAPDPGLDRLIADLRQLSPRCRLLAESVCGEPDLRVEVRCPDDGLAVELLCCSPPAGPDPLTDVIDTSRWQAVRVDDGCRQVWQGPPSDCDRAAVVRFVADLLNATEDELGRRYELLG